MAKKAARIPPELRETRRLFETLIGNDDQLDALLLILALA
jgi:hypothetical protein